jgi:hypothetical protein
LNCGIGGRRGLEILVSAAFLAGGQRNGLKELTDSFEEQLGKEKWQQPPAKLGNASPSPGAAPYFRKLTVLGIVLRIEPEIGDR